ncbi:MAG: Gx transporter family protein [Firmicutes bacterium]|nr:Gx transporter family protein [Bacillota bacterium]
MKVNKLTRTALMLSLIIVLSALENMLPPLPALPPGVHLGLSNIVTMYALFTTGKKTAVLLNVLKSVFVFITRGAIAGALSLSGGMLSILIIIALKAALADKISFAALSVAGAVFHNAGQLAAITVILDNFAAVYYLPVLIVSGVVMGSVTGTVLNVVMPRLGMIWRK